MAEAVKWTILVDTEKGIAELKKLDSEQGKVRQGMDRLSKTASGLKSRFISLKGAVTALAGATGLGLLSRSFINTAASFEQMRISLDTITKGRGEEWFERLNKWALKMPINTEKAIEAFIMMRAMGLEPTIEMMTTLVDTTSALGGGADKLQGIARALGQMTTKGKVAAQEMMQLAEQGVPAYEILMQKFNLTGEELENLARSGISAQEAVMALFEGMEERFGGMSSKMMTAWNGMVDAVKSYIKEFSRLVAQSGSFDLLEQKLKGVVDYLDKMLETGRMAEWAEMVSNKIVSIANFIENRVIPAMTSVYGELSNLWGFYRSLPSWVQEIGVVTAILGGKKWAIAMGGILYTLDLIKKTAEGIEMTVAGKMNLKEFFSVGGEDFDKAYRRLKQQEEVLRRLSEGNYATYFNGEKRPSEVEKKKITMSQEAKVKEKKEIKSFYDDILEFEMEQEQRRLQMVAMMNNEMFNLKQKFREEDIKAEEEAYKRIMEELENHNIDKMRIVQMELERTRSIFSDLTQIMGNAGKQRKEFFLFFKALAMAEAVISANLAATKVLGQTGIFGIPLSSLIYAQALTHVAAIASQQPAGFAEGGIATGSKSGYPVILHGTEAVIPLKNGAVPVVIQGRGNGGNINITINNPNFTDKYEQEKVIAKIASAVVKKEAPVSVASNYNNDGVIRGIIRGGV